MKRAKRAAALWLAAALALSLLAGCGRGEAAQSEAASAPTGPDLSVFEDETPDASTAAWSKNGEGWYVNDEGYRIRAAVSRGLDVSEWQGEIDWNKVAESDFSFAILRCGAGGEWDGVGEYNQDDEKWRDNVEGCRKAGLPIGCYLYSYANTADAARSEAEHVARLLGLIEPPLEGLEDYTASPAELAYPVYLDLEDAHLTGLFPSELAEIVQAFCDRLRELGYEGEIGLYTNKNWAQYRLTDPYFDQFEEHLWIAEYASECSYNGVYGLWQSTHTLDGTDFGVPASVDVNYLMESVELAANEVALQEGESFALAGRAAPAGLTLTYESAAPEIATVDESGNVTAVQTGRTVVTATTQDGLATAQCVVNVGTVTATLLCTGNIRGDLSAGIGLDGLAALKADIDNCLLVDCGNSLQGTEFAALTAGQEAARLMSAAGYQAQSLGRHDLAYGRAPLLSALTCQGGPTLAANLLGGSGLLLYRSSSRNHSIVSNGADTLLSAAGKTIGVFGLTSQDADQTAVGRQLSYVSYVDAAALELQELAGQGADAVVLLCDLDSVTLRRLLDGLSDDQLQMLTAVASSGLTEESRPYTRGGRSVAIACAADGLNRIGRLDITFSAVSGVSAEAKLLTESELSALTFEGRAAQAESEMQQTMQNYAAAYEEDCAETFVWNVPQGTGADTAVGDLAADAYLAAADAALGEEAAGFRVAVTRGGAQPVSGMLTAGDCLSLLPTGQTVQLTAVSGARLYDLLEQGADGESCLQCAGFGYVYAPAAAQGGRVTGVTLNDGTAVPNDDSVTVYLAADSELLAGLEGAVVITDLGDAYYLAEQAILGYTNAGQPIPSPDGRITKA